MKPMRLVLLSLAILLEAAGIVILSAGKPPVLGIVLLVLGMVLLVLGMVTGASGFSQGRPQRKP